MDDFGAWLAAQVCGVCGGRATHRQAGAKVCNAHLNNDVRAFALND